jgi:hypothetical protein
VPSISPGARKRCIHARIRSRVVPTIWDNPSWEIVGALRRLRRSLLAECGRAATASSPDAVCSPPSLDGKRRGLLGNERAHPELLGQDECWVADLARELGLSYDKLRDWAGRGWVHGRQTPVQGYWIMWAEDRELTGYVSSWRAAELTTPTQSPKQKT